MPAYYCRRHLHRQEVDEFPKQNTTARIATLEVTLGSAAHSPVLSRSTGVIADFIGSIRPQPGAPPMSAEINVKKAVYRLNKNADERQALQDALHAVLGLPGQTAFYSEAGVRSARGFWLELTKRCSEACLPPVLESGQLTSIVQRLFPHQRDLTWISCISVESWRALADCLWQTNEDRKKACLAALDANIAEAATFVSFRLAGGGLDRELLRSAPTLDNRSSPFLQQNQILQDLLNAPVGAPTPRNYARTKIFFDHLAECRSAIAEIRMHAADRGISIRLSYHLTRLEQLVRRLQLLIAVKFPEPNASGCECMSSLFLALLKGALSGPRILPLIREDTALLARNITENASRRGEHYIAENRAELLRMLRAAAGGGLIIAVMAAIKIKLHEFHLAPLTEGLVYGLNYGLGFVLIHILGCSVATKQPAMTAASIAWTLDKTGSGDISRLLTFGENVIRSQFIAVIGNVALALPAACLITLMWPDSGHGALLNADTARELLQQMHPLESGALVYAGVAGVGLFLSGLVSGYFDNRARYHGLAARIAALPAIRSLRADSRRAFGAYADKHYGAVAGNLFFGFFLGFGGEISRLTGLPIDVRHIAFSAANAGSASTVLPPAELLSALPPALAGLAGIGIINLLVSFYLALNVAMWSRPPCKNAVARFSTMMASSLLRNPIKFLTPPKS